MRWSNEKGAPMKCAVRIGMAAMIGVLAAVSTPGPALASEGAPAAVGPARAAYDRAMEAYQAERFRQAAEGFEDAYALEPQAPLLWNIGRAWEQAGEMEKARDSYTKFLAHEDVDSELRIKVADALVRVGASLQSQSDARAEEQRIAEARAALARAEAARAADAAAGGGSGPLDVSASRETPSKAPSPWSWVSLGVGVAGVAVGTWLLVDAKSNRDAVRSAIDGAQFGVVQTLSLADAEKLESHANRNAAIGVASLAVGGALTATGVVLAILTRGRSTESNVSFGAQPRPGGASFSAVGRF
jgi:tetratricopeptide (TPR) repeat protein